MRFLSPGSRRGDGRWFHGSAAIGWVVRKSNGLPVVVSCLVGMPSARGANGSCVQPSVQRELHTSNERVWMEW